MEEVDEKNGRKFSYQLLGFSLLNGKALFYNYDIKIFLSEKFRQHKN